MRKRQRATSEMRARMSLAQRGHPVSEEQRIKLRIARLGRLASAEARANMSKARKGKPGKPCSLETKAKLSVFHTGLHPSKETRFKMSLHHRGHPHSEETKKKLRLTSTGENNAHWRGGTHILYGSEFNKSLKKIIKRRDDYLCQNPECYIRENGKTHHCHHIDFDKKNCNPINLITLCNPCHQKTIKGDWNYWTEYYQNIQKMRGLMC